MKGCGQTAEAVKPILEEKEKDDFSMTDWQERRTQTGRRQEPHCLLPVPG